MNNKKTILIISIAIIVLVSFGFAKEALAGYHSSGTLISKNLLENVTGNIYSIDSFYYNASVIPAGTSLKAQFSKDNTNWYNSAGILNGWDDCPTTTGATINLSTLGWSGPNFYYKMEFTSGGVNTPVLDEIKVNYTIDNPPVITSVSDNSPKCGNEVITFTSVASDPDAGNTIKLYICKDSSCTNCGPTAGSGCWASSTAGVTSNPTISYTCPSCDYSTNNYWAKVCDNIGACSSIITSLAGWLPGYGYRKQITINGTTAGAQTNYQMKLTVYKGSGTDSTTTPTVYLNNHCQDDFDDIRFTKMDSSTSLDYWIEATSTATATVWIEFDSLPASTSTNFYIYYGNSGASSASNRYSTFPYPLNFSFENYTPDAEPRDRPDNWSYVDGVSERVTVTGSDPLVHQNKIIQLGWINNTGRAGNTASISQNVDLTNVGLLSLYLVSQASDTTYNSYARSNLKVYIDSTFIVNFGHPAAAGQIVYKEVAISGYSGTHTLKLQWEQISADNMSGAGLDFVTLRNYASPEPTWGTWGGEEKGQTPFACKKADNICSCGSPSCPTDGFCEECCGGCCCSGSCSTCPCPAINHPTVTNDGGESNLGTNSVRLNGDITDTGGENSTASFYWGTTDGVTTSANWENQGVAPDSPSQPMGTGPFYKDISGLTPGKTYYYRSYAVNSAGTDWADTTEVFTTLTPGVCNPHNVWGWAWSENIGWISFSCEDTMTVGVEGPDYGVHIDDNNSSPTYGQFSGYAWSRGTTDNPGGIGWIRFDPPPDPTYSNGYPAPPYYSARVSTTTGEVSGWARACAGTANPDICATGTNPAAGGWDGWIKLRN